MKYALWSSVGTPAAVSAAMAGNITSMHIVIATVLVLAGMYLAHRFVR